MLKKSTFTDHHHTVKGALEYYENWYDNTRDSEPKENYPKWWDLKWDDKKSLKILIKNWIMKIRNSLFI